MFEGVDLVLSLFMTVWKPIVQYWFDSVGRLNKYALVIGSPKLTVFDGLFASVHVVPVD